MTRDSWELRNEHEKRLTSGLGIKVEIIAYDSLGNEKRREAWDASSKMSHGGLRGLRCIWWYTRGKAACGLVAMLNRIANMERRGWIVEVRV